MQKEKLGLWSLVFMGLGNVIGAGVVTYIGVAVGHTGRSAWLAYLVAILLGFLVNLPVIFMTCAVRIKGGNYTCVSATMGDVLAGFYGISNLLQVFLFANFALGMGSYLTIVFLAIPAKAWGVIGLTLFMVVNLLGLKTLSRFQNIMSVVLVGSLLAIGVYGVAHGLPDSLDIMQAGLFQRRFRRLLPGGHGPVHEHPGVHHDCRPERQLQESYPGPPPGKLHHSPRPGHHLRHGGLCHEQRPAH